jgi:microcystin-dependent protein
VGEDGGAQYPIGTKGGAEQVTMSLAQMPQHTHALTGGNNAPMVSSKPGTQPDPTATVNTLAAFSNADPALVNNAYNNANPDVALNTGTGGGVTGTLQPAGAGQPFSVIQPILDIVYAICAYPIDYNSTPVMGEIGLFATTALNDDSQDWLQCYGKMLPCGAYGALSSLLGNAFGGDGYNSFALPDLRGAVPIHMGQGPGLSNRQFGQKGGNAATILSHVQLPQHKHNITVSSQGSIMVSNQPGTSSQPTAAANTIGAATEPTLTAVNNAYNNETPDTLWNTGGQHTTIAFAGGNTPVSLMQPYMPLGYYINISGEYPVRQ